MELKSAARAGISLLLVAALLYLADIPEILDHLARAEIQPYLLGIAVFLTTYPAAALRWRKLSTGIGYDLSLFESLRLVSISYSFNKLFPGNAGDLARSKVLQRYREVNSHSEVLGIVALERYFSVIALLSIITVSIPFLQFRFQGVQWVLLLFSAVAAALSMGLLVDQERLEMFLEYAPLTGPLQGVLEGYRSSRRLDMAYSLACSLYIRSAEAVTFFLFITALDSGIGFWTGAFVTSAMSLVSALPISPAGLGAVDAAGTAMLMLAGLSYTGALSLVMLERTAGLVLMGFIGVAVYLAEEYLF
ncbi:MAG: YbhN family protein [Candidatus Nanohaloarchaea archaeon]